MIPANAGIPEFDHSDEVGGIHGQTIVDLHLSSFSRALEFHPRRTQKPVLQAAQKAMGDVGLQSGIQAPATLMFSDKCLDAERAAGESHESHRKLHQDHRLRFQIRERRLGALPRPIRWSRAADGRSPATIKRANFVSGEYAWDMPGSKPVPQPGAAAERQLQIWLTPHGFLKAAMENNATAKKGTAGTVVTFETGKYKVEGTISAQNLVTKTETWLPNPVLGDMPVETSFTAYKDFKGVKFPTVIVQKQGGQPVLELTVSSVNPNPGLDVSVPDAVKTAAPPPIKVQSQKIGDGIWFVAGGSHNSMVVEFPTYITVIEGPLSEARSLAVIAEAKRLVPNKPIKYLINTHSHFDHSGGVRTYVAEGATIITQEINVPFYQKAWAAPRKLAPDNFSKGGKEANFLPVKGKYVLSEGNQTLQIFHENGSMHSSGYVESSTSQRKKSSRKLTITLPTFRNWQPPVEFVLRSSLPT